MIRKIIEVVTYRFFSSETSYKRNRRKIKNTNFSLISSNCNGGVIIHDLQLPFNTPFVNLWINPKDFIKLCDNLVEYMEHELVQVKDETVDYPVGKLKDIRINFTHYASFDDAKESWDRRKLRINYNNLYFMFSERDGCEYEDLIAFDALSNPHKIVFVHKPYKELKSAFYIKGFENQSGVGILTKYRDEKLERRYLDDFNYVRWFNND